MDNALIKKASKGLMKNKPIDLYIVFDSYNFQYDEATGFFGWNTISKTETFNTFLLLKSLGNQVYLFFGDELEEAGLLTSEWYNKKYKSNQLELFLSDADEEDFFYINATEFVKYEIIETDWKHIQTPGFIPQYRYEIHLYNIENYENDEFFSIMINDYKNMKKVQRWLQKNINKKNDDNGDIELRLTKLKNLYQKGLIDEEAYKKRRDDILKEI